MGMNDELGNTWKEIFNFSFEYTKREAQENKEELEFHGTKQLLVCADVSL
jgi:hypothetical protein